MFFKVQSINSSNWSPLVESMFKLRKKVFHDQLQWNVNVDGDYEFDQYDNNDCIYFVWSDAERSKLYASVRLIPTTKPTLLYDTFRNSFPKSLNLAVPGIWEATRACLDHSLIKADFPEMTTSYAFGLLTLATCECAYLDGQHTIVSNYAPQFNQVYLRAGAMFLEVGRAEGFGDDPVCCGTLNISSSSIRYMQQVLQQPKPLYEPSASLTAQYITPNGFHAGHVSAGRHFQA